MIGIGWLKFYELIVDGEIEIVKVGVIIFVFVVGF